MRKMAGDVPETTESESLNDADILSDPIIVEPLVVKVEGEIEVSNRVDTTQIYNSIV